MVCLGFKIHGWWFIYPRSSLICVVVLVNMHFDVNFFLGITNPFHFSMALMVCLGFKIHGWWFIYPRSSLICVVVLVNIHFDVNFFFFESLILFIFHLLDPLFFSMKVKFDRNGLHAPSIIKFIIWSKTGQMVELNPLPLIRWPWFKLVVLLPPLIKNIITRILQFFWKTIKNLWIICVKIILGLMIMNGFTFY
jgi:hypothetical protein